MANKYNNCGHDLYNLNKYSLRFRNIILSLFKWNNLPPSVDEEYLERILCDHGKIAFFEFNERLIALQYTSRGTHNINVYGKPIMIQPYSIGPHQFKPRLREEVVICWNNKVRLPTWPLVHEYFGLLEEIDQTVILNIRGQKYPKFISGPQEAKKSILAIIKKVEQFFPWIPVKDKAINTIQTSVLDMTVPFVADRLYNLKVNYFNELLSILGINSTDTTKRERMVTDEVNSNNTYVQLSGMSFLGVRQKTAEEINRKFAKYLDGKEVSVEFNTNALMEFYALVNEYNVGGETND